MYGVNRLLTVMPALFTLEHKSPSSRLGPAGAGWASRDSSSASRLAPDKRAASPRAASQLARTEGAPPRLGPWPHHPTPPPPPMQHRALGHLRCQAHLERALCEAVVPTASRRPRQRSTDAAKAGESASRTSPCSHSKSCRKRQVRLQWSAPPDGKSRPQRRPGQSRFATTVRTASEGSQSTPSSLPPGS